MVLTLAAVGCGGGRPIGRAASAVRETVSSPQSDELAAEEEAREHLAGSPNLIDNVHRIR